LNWGVFREDCHGISSACTPRFERRSKSQPG
jgi:hypothetical protein